MKYIMQINLKLLGKYVIWMILKIWKSYLKQNISAEIKLLWSPNFSFDLNCLH